MDVSLQVGCAKIAEQINILLGVDTLGDPRSLILNEGSHPPQSGDLAVDFGHLFVWLSVVSTTAGDVCRGYM